jgi:hypothetical protein
MAPFFYSLDAIMKLFWGLEVILEAYTVAQASNTQLYIKYYTATELPPRCKTYLCTILLHILKHVCSDHLMTQSLYHRGHK